MAITTPMGQINGICAILRGTDLGLATADFTLGASATKNLTAIETPVPLKVRIITKLTSGSATLTADVNATGTYASADKTLALAGTDEQVMTVVTTSSDRYVNFRIATGGGGAAVIEYLEVDVIGKLPANWDWHSVRSAMNALAAQVNSGDFTADNND